MGGLTWWASVEEVWQGRLESLGSPSSPLAIPCSLLHRLCFSAHRDRAPSSWKFTPTAQPSCVRGRG
jgi:hypothetical protein